MVFSSLEFIFIYLPLFLPLYYIVPEKGRNLLLLSGSILFYTYGNWSNPAYVLLLLLSIAVNYVLGKAVGSARFFSGKGFLITGLFYNLAWLIFFKYFSNQGLPVGISFYTFQMMAYLIDVYRKNIAAETSLITLGTYFCMFPQLTSGPLVSYGKLAPSLKARSILLEDIEEGLKTFVIGLGLKILLANQLGGLWKDIYAIGFESISTPLAWLGIIGFSLQIYFDFWGYSLMATGLGKLLGFSLPVNFDHPYTALSMTQFWRKWHISLGNWFKNYLYIPLGGNRCSFWKTTRNLALVWLCTGIWHGAEWNFLLWAAFLFVLIFVEKLGLGKLLTRFPVLGHLYMMIAIPLSWLLFAISDVAQLKIYFLKLFPMFGTAGEVLFAGDYLKYGKIYALSLLLGILFATRIPSGFYQKHRKNFLVIICLLAVFWYSIYCLLKGMNDPFMYFKF